MKITQTTTYDITLEYQEKNNSYRFEGVTDEGYKALTGFFGWNTIAVEIKADNGYFSDSTAQDLLSDIEGDHGVKVIDLDTVEAK
tara:strand:+ start:209 stop:463 length:255 start_codon:yes stop_codon:yes gene_type:complete